MAPVNKSLDIDVLRGYLAIVRLGSFSAAAQSLHRTQSTLSMQVQRLEALLDARLLERRRSGVVPTPAGLGLLGPAAEILALNDRVFESRAPATLSGEVRIGAIEHYATSVLPTLIAAFCRRHPTVFVETRTGIPGQTPRQLASNYDLVVGASTAGSGDGSVVAKARVVWATSPRHAPERQRPVPLALYPEGALFGTWALDALNRVGMPWRVVYRSNNIAALLASVDAGLGVGVFDEASLPARLRRLRVSDGFPALPKADIWISNARPDASRATLALREDLVRTLQARAPRTRPV